jgi:uncharacterized protein
MSKILIFSDIHNDLKSLARLMDTEADYYFAAGDLVNWDKGLDAAGEVMRKRAGKMFVIPGNHETESGIARFCDQFGFTALHGRSVEIDGFHIAALGYSNPTPFNTPGEYAEPEIAARLTPFAELKPLILICHCPPKDTPLDGAKPGAHFGSTAVAEFLRASQPVRFYCGHIHECEGVVTQMGSTIGQNVGRRAALLDLANLAVG